MTALRVGFLGDSYQKRSFTRQYQHFFRNPKLAGGLLLVATLCFNPAEGPQTASRSAECRPALQLPYVEPGVLMSAGCSNVGHLKIEGVSFGGIWRKFHQWCSNYWGWHAPNLSAIRQSPRGKKEPFSTGSGNTSKSKFLFELTWDNSWSKKFF